MTLPGLVRANNLNDVVDRERAWDNLGSSLATGDISIPAPSLDLNFAANKSLVDDISGNNLITFTRASVGTFVGSNGLIQTAASGVPRFDHNPTTGESLGLLVEEARINLILNSEFTPVQNILRFTPTYIAGVTRPDGTVGYVLELTTTATSPSDACFVRFTNNPAAGVPNTAYGGSLWLSSSSTAGSIYLKVNDSAGLSPGGTLCNVTSAFARFTVVNTSASNFSFVDLTAFGYPAGTKFYVWGTQLEAGASVTSYIPTSGSESTRAADVASITGANLSSWYNQNEGTCLIAGKITNSNRYLFNFDNTSSVLNRILSSPPTYALGVGDGTGFINISSTVALNANFKLATAFKANNFNLANNGVLGTPVTSGAMPTGVNRLNLFSTGSGGERNNGTIARLAYWPSRLNDKSLPYITQPSITAINLYAFNYAINGKDVLALNAVRNASTRNFIFIKGLLSAAQPRLTAAAASTSSALTLATNALPKLSPTSSGNYFFASGITLSGVTTRINGTNALSIATSPFSGSTATAPLLFRELRPQANWRFTEPMPSGTIASPEFAIPFETNDFVLFMKAGPN